MCNGLTSRKVLVGILFFFISSPSLHAGDSSPLAVYGEVPGKWSFTDKGHRDKFVPVFGYGNGVYAVPFIHTDLILVLDTDGEGFAECRAITEGQGSALPIPIPDCGPQGPRCTAYPYKCSSELKKPLFIDTNIRPTTSERLQWSESNSPSPAFEPIGKLENNISPFYFERSSKPTALAGKVLLHGAWLTGPNKFHPGADESYPASTYVHYGQALYVRDASGTKFLSAPAINLGEASAFEPASKEGYQWEGETWKDKLHERPQHYPFNKIYTVPGGLWLEIDWEADFEGAGSSTNTMILQVIDGKVSEYTLAQKTRMY